MTAVLLTPPYLQFFDDDGTPLAGGKVYTYTATGTLSTPKATYTTAAGTVEAPNPVILDASGRPETGNGSIWLTGTYDFKVTDSLDNTIETTFGVTAFTTLPSQSDAYFESFSGNGTQTSFTTSEDLGTDEKAIFVWVDNGLQQAVTNGSFATDSGWTKGAGWTIATGTAIATGAISTALSQTAAITLVASQAYVLTYTVTRSAGGIIPSIGGTSGVERTASGTYTEVISCGTTQTLAFTGNAFTGTLDNISVTVADPKGYDIQSPSNYTINGTSLVFATAPATGTGNIYVSAPSLLVGAASSSAADAAASAAAALASETAAAAYAGQLTIVSTTSIAIGTGSKVFTVAANLALSAGQFILIASDANPSVNYMWGQIASYSGVTLTITVAATGGSGTLADWTMYLTGERGAVGATGSINDFTGVSTDSIATGDYLVFQDISAANVTKKDTVANLLALQSQGVALLSTQTASASASIAFDSSLITSTYKTYFIEIINLVPSVDASSLRLTASIDNGSNYLAGTNYVTHVGELLSSSSTYSSYVSTGEAFMMISELIGTGTGENYSGTIHLNNPADTTVYKNFSTTGANYNSTPAFMYLDGGCTIKTTSAINNIKLAMSSGNIASGTFKLYGVL